jgi:GNAT superfamily N-acetyltransferase
VTVELRSVTVADWRLLREIRLRALADAPKAFGTTLDQARGLSDAEWRARAGGGGGVTLLALDDGVAVAMGGLFAPPDRAIAFVWGMWTDPVARGRGVGGQLLDSLVARCRDAELDGAHHDELRLHVTEGNAGARELYVGRGFRSTGTWEPLRDGSSLRIEELRLVF